MNDEIYKELQAELGETVEFNYLLSNLSKIGVGGVCTYYYLAIDIKSVIKAVSLAIQYEIPYLVIGQGCDVVPSDRGFFGLVIKNISNNIIFGPDGSEAIVDSGVTLPSFINYSAGRDLGGLEFLNGYDGSVGGAIYGNYKYKDYSISDFVKSVTVLIQDGKDIKYENISCNRMEFCLNSSFIKDISNTHKPIILTARVQLIKRRKDEILRLMKESLVAKKFSRVETQQSIINFFLDTDLESEEKIDQLLEGVNNKKQKIGGAQFSREIPNCIINRKNARAEDIRALADLARDNILEKCGHSITERIEYIGQW
ncbi:MAG: FAD-binding protein [Patescibacteria group bacterium]